MKTAQSAEFREFLAGYLTALYWSSSDTVNGEDVHLDGYQASTAADDAGRADCLAFFKANRADIAEAATHYRSSQGSTGFEMAGHDFALTRNGHGAGYWDGDLPDDLGDRLTEASKAAGEVWPYIGDDGLIYV